MKIELNSPNSKNQRFRRIVAALETHPVVKVQLDDSSEDTKLRYLLEHENGYSCLLVLSQGWHILWVINTDLITMS
jgi:hypothetical protein